MCIVSTNKYKLKSVLFFLGVKSVYFTKPLFRFGLPDSHDIIIGQVVALPNSTDRCPKENVIYKILQPSIFTVNTSGWIRVAKGTNSGMLLLLLLSLLCLVHRGVVSSTHRPA